MCRRAMLKLVADKHYIIYAVRRLSDNTTWTVGDKVLIGTYQVPQLIVSFFLEDNHHLCVETNELIIDICRLQPDRKPLFTLDIYDKTRDFEVKTK